MEKIYDRYNKEIAIGSTVIFARPTDRYGQIYEGEVINIINEKIIIKYTNEESRRFIETDSEYYKRQIIVLY